MTTRRVEAPAAVRLAVLADPECVVCGTLGSSGHHVLPRDGAGTWPTGDDVPENIVTLCGTGTTGCHGRIEAFDRSACRTLHGHVLSQRPDTVGYLAVRIGSRERARLFLWRRYYDLGGGNG